MDRKSPIFRKLYVSSTLFVALVAIVLLIHACQPEEEVWQPTPYHLQIPRFFPQLLNIPDDNPLTVEGVELGRYLFYDSRLSGYMGTNPDSMLSCADCHSQAHNFDVGTDNPRFPGGVTYGLSGAPTPHSPMPLVNLVFNHNGYFWNGMIHKDNPDPNRRSLENVVTMGIQAPHEMNSTVERAINALKQVDYYPPMFKKAFGTEEITQERIEKAVAQFLRVLVSGDSKFDRYLRGEEQLSPQELRGYVLFTTEEGADCFHCHGSDGVPLFTTNDFYNNALSATHDDSRDRYAVTGKPSDHGAYRAPSLRNVAVSAPYMHDGRFKTLDEVLEFYNTGLVNSPYVHPYMHKIDEGGRHLTPSQIADLKAFILTLTDEAFLTDPRFAKPDKLNAKK